MKFPSRALRQKEFRVDPERTARWAQPIVGKFLLCFLLSACTLARSHLLTCTHPCAAQWDSGGRRRRRAGEGEDGEAGDKPAKKRKRLDQEKKRGRSDDEEVSPQPLRLETLNPEP